MEAIQSASPASMLPIGTRNFLSTARLLVESGTLGQFAEVSAFTTTGNLPFQSCHTFGFVANSHM